MSIVIELEHYTCGKWVKINKRVSVPETYNEHKAQELADYTAGYTGALAWSWYFA